MNKSTESLLAELEVDSQIGELEIAVKRLETAARTKMYVSGNATPEPGTQANDGQLGKGAVVSHHDIVGAGYQHMNAKVNPDKTATHDWKNNDTGHQITTKVNNPDPSIPSSPVGTHTVVAASHPKR